MWERRGHPPLERLTVGAEGGVAVLRGDLAPNGAVIKPSAADPPPARARGPAVVFDDYNDMDARIDDPATRGDARLRARAPEAGPLGGPGMPEWGMLPIPKKLLAQGIRDMVRISDARMSGTSYGTACCTSRPRPRWEGHSRSSATAIGIALDVAGRRLDLLVDDAELERRRGEYQAREPRFARGYGKLFSEHVTQAELGCDFDFLHAGTPTPDPAIHKARASAAG